MELETEDNSSVVMAENDSDGLVSFATPGKNCEPSIFLFIARNRT